MSAVPNVFAGTAAGFADGLDREPGAGQAAAIPEQGRGAVGDDRDIAAGLQDALVDLAQVGAEQGEAVGVVAEEIAFDEDAGDRMRLLLVRAARLELRCGPIDEGCRHVGRVVRHQRHSIEVG